MQHDTNRHPGMFRTWPDLFRFTFPLAVAAALLWFAHASDREDRKLAEALAHERARIDAIQLEVYGDDAAPRLPSVWVPEGGPSK